MKKNVVDVTGLGCICAAGNCLAEVMTALYSGTRNPKPSSRIQTGLAHAYPVFEVDSNLDDIANLKSDKPATRTTKLALKATLEALQHAQIEHKQLSRFRVGVCIGTTVGCTLNNEPFYRDFKSNKMPKCAAINGYIQNNTALYLSDYFNLSGPAATIANACSSGTDAIGLAKSWIENGLCEIAIAGGADELSRITYLGFVSLLITSKQACCPFDKNRSGLNLGEGAGIIILENSEIARSRGGKSLVEITGYGCGCDAYHPTAPHPNGIGLNYAINQVLHQSCITPKEIGFINAHGTSTPDNDRVEGKTVANIFPPNVPIVSTKSYTGHTLGAAGGLEAVFTVQGLIDQKIPATAGFVEPDPDCICVPTTQNTDVNTDFALSNSLAFGGNNSALVFRRKS